MALLPTPLKWLLLKILKQKVRWPGACVTFQEVINILIYGLAMGWAIIFMRSPIDAPLSPSPVPELLWTDYGGVAAPLQPCGISGAFTKLLFAPDTPLTRTIVTATVSSLVTPGDDPSAPCHQEAASAATL